MLQGKVRTGELDREIAFIQEVTSRGASNQDKIDSWELIDTDPYMFSRKTEMRGNEVVIGDQLKYVQKTIFLIRYRDDLTTKNRVVLGSRVYEIISITEVGELRKTWLDVVANFIDNETFTVPVGAGSGFSEDFDTGFE